MDTLGGISQILLIFDIMLVTFRNMSSRICFCFSLAVELDSRIFRSSGHPVFVYNWKFGVVGCACLFLISDSLCLIAATHCVLQDGWCGLKETCESASASAICILLWCSIFYHLQEDTSHPTPPVSALYI